MLPVTKIVLCALGFTKKAISMEVCLYGWGSQSLRDIKINTNKFSMIEHKITV